MNKVCDPVMDEVYATRRDLSAAVGHDAAAYFALVQNEKREAERQGISYFDYCLAMVNCKSVAGPQNAVASLNNLR